MSVFDVLSFDLGLRNLAYCHASGRAGERCEIRDWAVVDVLEGAARPSKLTIEKLGLRLLRCVDARFANLDRAVTVAIEQQPIGRARVNNVTMKILSHQVYTYFYCKGHAVRFVSPRKKLRGLPTPDASSKPAQRYAHNKRVVVGRCARDMDSRGASSPWARFFAGLSKQDDAADCYMQAKAVIEDLAAEEAKAERMRARAAARIQKQRAAEERKLAAAERKREKAEREREKAERKQEKAERKREKVRAAERKRDKKRARPATPDVKRSRRRPAGDSPPVAPGRGRPAHRVQQEPQDQVPDPAGEVELPDGEDDVATEAVQ